MASYLERTKAASYLSSLISLTLSYPIVTVSALPALSFGLKIEHKITSNQSGNNGAGTAARAESGRRFLLSRVRSSSSKDLRSQLISTAAG